MRLQIVERVAPARLGSGFRWLLAASWTSNLGDGFALSAGPLLLASVTRNPTLVALALLLQQVPWLGFGLVAGAVADRNNRAAVVAVADLLRTAVLAFLAISIFAGAINIGLVLAAIFVMGTAEVFANTAAATLVPSVVGRADLTLANSRVQAAFVTVYQLVGPPVGAALFALGRPLPFVGQALLVVAGAAMISRLLPVARVPAVANRPSGRVGAEIVEGFRWVRHNAAVRTLVLTILTFNITFGAAWSVLVLYARQRLGMDAVGFGLLTTASAVGGIIGTSAYGWITHRVSLGNVMRAGLIIETLTHLSLALTRSPVIALGIMVAFGAHAFIWTTTSVTVRQRAVPPELQGRVSSVNGIATYAGIVAGAALGGPIASRFGITAPFWFAFAGSAVFVVLIWRQLAHIAHDDEPVPTVSDQARG